MDRREFINLKRRELENICRVQGIPLTMQRQIILETLAARTDHPTADQIYDAVKGLIRGLSRTTVYRVLEMMVRLGVVVKVSNLHAKARFDANTARHHHLLCLTCDAVIDCHDERLNMIEMPVLAPTDFEIEDFSLS